MSGFGLIFWVREDFFARNVGSSANAYALPVYSRTIRCVHADFLIRYHLLGTLRSFVMGFGHNYDSASSYLGSSA